VGCIVVCTVASTLTGCSWMPARQATQTVPAPHQPAPRTTAADGTAIITSAGVEIEKMPFRAGVSSATVERLAKQQGCEGGLGASLISEPGPVEIYRMACGNGKTFLARCELRQCTPGIKPH
jgi:hypothetical protein